MAARLVNRSSCLVRRARSERKTRLRRDVAEPPTSGATTGRESTIEARAPATAPVVGRETVAPAREIETCDGLQTR